MNRLRSRVKNIVKAESGVSKQHKHCFETDSEIQSLRTALLDWYDVNKRDLQWRNLAKHEDPNIRAYSGKLHSIHSYLPQFSMVA